MLYIKRVSIVMVGQTILSFRWINKHRLKNSSYHNHFGYEAYALTALNLGLEGIGVLWCWGKVVVMMFGKGDYPIITTSTPPYTHAPTHAGTSLPINPNPILTPGAQYRKGLHDTAAIPSCMLCILTRKCWTDSTICYFIDPGIHIITCSIVC